LGLGGWYGYGKEKGLAFGDLVNSMFMKYERDSAITTFLKVLHLSVHEQRCFSIVSFSCDTEYRNSEHSV